MHFEAAIKANKPRLMEKPVSTDPPAHPRVLPGCGGSERKNLKVGVGLQRHHQPP